MKQTRFLRLVAFVALIGLTWSSCADLDITKRRYRPGFHVSAGSGKAQQKAETKPYRAEKSATAQTMAPTDTDSPTARVDVDEEIYIAQSTDIPDAATQKALRKQRNKEALREAMAPLTDPSAYTKMMRELRAEMRAGKFRKAVFDQPQEEKQGWTVVGIIAMPVGIVALIMAIITLVSVISLLISGNPFSVFSFLAFGIVAIILGIAGLILGVIGKKQTKDGKRGKGFAIVGMITGIIGMALGIIFTLWGALFSLLSRDN